MAQMESVVFNDRIDAFMTAFFMSVVVAMLYFAFVAIRRVLNNPSAEDMAAVDTVLVS